MDFRSVAAGGKHWAAQLEEQYRAQLVAQHPHKTYWFISHGYQPHIWQHLFHGATVDDKLTPFRHLVAGRRGGKTLSAAWEILYYATHPEEFHRDAHGEESSEPLWIWALAKDFKLGRPSLLTFLKVIRKAGLVKNRDYQYNKTEKVFEFYGPGEELLSLVEFRSADDPESLRGAGLDILWIDESAHVPNRDAWDIVFPALTDKEGITITTTTPKGRNWFHAVFWSAKARLDKLQFRVEYTSIDNPHFSRRMWEYALENYHPVMFKQEFLASFDALAGIALQGEWLKFYVVGKPDVQTEDIALPRLKDEDGQLRFALRLFIGVDPAISLADDADHFAMALVGLTRDGTQAFLLDYYVDRIQFPDQLEKIKEWFLKYRPEYIGIESNAYQRALAQMAARMEGLPPVVPVISKSKKEERILGLGPIFRIGKVRIRKEHREFIQQWVSFDPAQKNGEDDLLDAVEIALGAAGVLLPRDPFAATLLNGVEPGSVEEMAYQQIMREKRDDKAYDPELGSQA